MATITIEPGLSTADQVAALGGGETFSLMSGLANSFADRARALGPDHPKYQQLLAMDRAVAALLHGNSTLIVSFEPLQKTP